MYWIVHPQNMVFSVGCVLLWFGTSIGKLWIRVFFSGARFLVILGYSLGRFVRHNYTSITVQTSSDSSWVDHEKSQNNVYQLSFRFYQQYHFDLRGRSGSFFTDLNEVLIWCNKIIPTKRNIRSFHKITALHLQHSRSFPLICLFSMTGFLMCTYGYMCSDDHFFTKTTNQLNIIATTFPCNTMNIHST